MESLLERPVGSMFGDTGIYSATRLPLGSGHCHPEPGRPRPSLLGKARDEDGEAGIPGLNDFDAAARQTGRQADRDGWMDCNLSPS